MIMNANKVIREHLCVICCTIRLLAAATAGHCCMAVHCFMPPGSLPHGRALFHAAAGHCRMAVHCCMPPRVTAAWPCTVACRRGSLPHGRALLHAAAGHCRMAVHCCMPPRVTVTVAMRECLRKPRAWVIAYWIVLAFFALWNQWKIGNWGMLFNQFYKTN